MDRFLVKESRKNETEEIDGNLGDRSLGRKVFSVQMVNAAGAGVGGNQPLGQLGHRQHKAKYPAIIGGTQGGHGLSLRAGRSQNSAHNALDRDARHAAEIDRTSAEKTRRTGSIRREQLASSIAW